MLGEEKSTNRVRFTGILAPDLHPIDREPCRMRTNFDGYVVVFTKELGLRHAVYLRGVSACRAVGYAIAEARALGAEAEVMEAHTQPYDRGDEWSEEQLAGIGDKAVAAAAQEVLQAFHSRSTQNSPRYFVRVPERKPS